MYPWKLLPLTDLKSVRGILPIILMRCACGALIFFIPPFGSPLGTPAVRKFPIFPMSGAEPINFTFSREFTDPKKFLKTFRILKKFGPKFFWPYR